MKISKANGRELVGFHQGKEDWEGRRSQSGEEDDTKPNAYHRDRARVMHSAAFRRLQGKTQVLGLSEGDFHRTRLTHSLEVAQLAMGILEQCRRKYEDDDLVLSLLPSEALITAVCLAHDLGHPPFGHKGEEALNYAMRNYGGFEGNGQTLRILSHLEHHTTYHRQGRARTTQRIGLNLTRRTLLGVLKYPVQYKRVCAKEQEVTLEREKAEVRLADGKVLKATVDLGSQAPGLKPPKCYLDCEYPVVQKLLETFTDQDKRKFVKLGTPRGITEHGQTLYQSLDASIMDVADEIAYGVYDLEDGIALGFVTESKWNEQLEEAQKRGSIRTLPSKLGEVELGDIALGLFSRTSHVRKRMIGAIAHALVCNTKFEKRNEFESPLFDYRVGLTDEARELLDFLREVTHWRIVRLHPVRTLEWRGKRIVAELFDAINSSPKDLLRGEDFRRLSETNHTHNMRMICDYIAGMTDNYACRIYERLFLPRTGSVFERL